MLKILYILPVFLLLSACSGDDWFGEEKKLDVPGKRISVLSHEQKSDSDNKSAVKVELSAPVAAEEWQQSGRIPSHVLDNFKFSANPLLRWSHSIGKGSTYRLRLLSEPVVAGGIVYAFDAVGVLSAYELASGRKLWNKKLVTSTDDMSLVGAGIAYDGGNLFVTTGLGAVIAIDAQTQEILWEKNLGAPIRSASTVSGGKLYVLTADSRITALKSKDGSKIWDYASIPETTMVLGGASPAVSNGIVVAVFPSGEIMAFTADKGGLLWSDALSGSKKAEGLSAIMDIVARPIIRGNTVYVAGYSSTTSAFDLKSGDMKWSREISGASNPVLIDGYMFFITGDTNLIALEVATGKTIWVRDLPRYENEEDKKGRITWKGPLVLNSKILIVGTYGEMAFLDPKNGNLLSREKVAKSIGISPIYADGKRVLLNSEAELMVYE